MSTLIHRRLDAARGGSNSTGGCRAPSGRIVRLDHARDKARWINLR